MNLAYSMMPPVKLFGDQRTFLDLFHENIKITHELRIAVGYVSYASLKELERLADEIPLQKVSLIIGMYWQEGFPERIYHEAVRIARKWKKEHLGEIRLILPFKYHGKAYTFYEKSDSDRDPFSALLGSANLSVLKPDASSRRQYELSVLIDEKEALHELHQHMEQLSSSSCSKNLLELENIKLIAPENMDLNGHELVDRAPAADLEYFNAQTPELSFHLKLKVPKAEDRFKDDGKHFTKSNINTCYAAPRSKKKSRNWFETQITVDSKIYKMEGYPNKKEPFYIITDDGYWFKAHTTSDNNKQFNAVGDELIMGRWLKGRLAAAGLVEPVNDTALDTDRKGMITQEMLDEYGRDELLFEKTGRTAKDKDGKDLDVWRLSFRKSETGRS